MSINRREFLKKSSVIAGVTIMPKYLSAMASKQSPPKKKPNILMIFPDQLRRQALSCYGDPNILTPNIDALAENGTKFTKACSSYPVCVPFRYTLMTGRPAHQENVPSIHYRISPDECTLADEFNDGGYETVYLGKWHLYGKRERIPREYRGRWQHWYGYDANADHFRVTYFRDDDIEPTIIENKYETDAIFDLGMEHLSKREDDTKPFCMVLSVTPPHDHGPDKEFYKKYPVHKRYPNKFYYRGPEEFHKKWTDKELILPPNFQPIDEAEREYFIQGMKGYYALVDNLDYNVARIRDYLKKNSLDKNTIIVFFSDHGELGGCHEGGMHKQSPYEESIGIPLIVYDPRNKHTWGKVIDEPVHTEDLYPTLLGLVGLQSERELVGENCATLIYGEKENLNRPGVMLEFVKENRRVFNNYNKAWRGFRTKHYKYTVMSEKNAVGKPWQFFDLKKDPYEINNLINSPQMKGEIKKHHEYLQAAMIKSEDTFPIE